MGQILGCTLPWCDDTTMGMLVQPGGCEAAVETTRLSPADVGHNGGSPYRAATDANILGMR